MNINQPIKNLGTIDVEPLCNLILAQEDAAWQEQQYRQQSYDVHKMTTSIVMVFTDGVGWPRIEVTKQPGWNRLATVAIPLMHEIVNRSYSVGGVIIRAMAVKLVSGGRIRPHIDSHPSFRASHRIHVPITTNPRVRMTIDGRPFSLKVGQAYEINNQKQHSVMNKGREDRITFIFDYIPPEKVKELERADIDNMAR